MLVFQSKLVSFFTDTFSNFSGAHFIMKYLHLFPVFQEKLTFFVFVFLQTTVSMFVHSPGEEILESFNQVHKDSVGVQ